MIRYAIAVHPSANRVYAAAAPDLIAAELQILAGSGALSAPIEQIAAERIAAVPYLTFSAPELTPADLQVLSMISGVFALFRLAADYESPVLHPVELSPLEKLDDDLVTIQKYRGKTNEQFTKLLLNVAVFSSAGAAQLHRRPLQVLDPLCGRGTTLNTALRYGFDAAGLDTDTKDVEAYWAFLRTWMKDKRLKHTASSGPVRRHKKVLGKKMELDFALTKQAHKAGDTRNVTLIVADTGRTPEFFAPASFDVVVTDAPYGVAHGSHGGGHSGSHSGRDLNRRPLDLVSGAVGPWSQVLRRGGCVAMSWNTKVAAREKVTELFAAAGLTVLDDGPYAALRHRVDSSITRDVIVARKD